LKYTVAPRDEDGIYGCSNSDTDQWSVSRAQDATGDGNSSLAVGRAVGSVESSIDVVTSAVLNSAIECSTAVALHNTTVSSRPVEVAVEEPSTAVAAVTAPVDVPAVVAQ
jgi:hypothetical protein